LRRLLLGVLLGATPQRLGRPQNRCWQGALLPDALIATPSRLANEAYQASSMGATVFGDPRPRCARTRSIVGRSPWASTASAAPQTSST